MDKQDKVVLLETPLVEVDFGRFTVGDVLQMINGPTYYWPLLEKLCVQDLNQVPFSYASIIIQRFFEELTKRMNNLPTTHELFRTD